MIADEGYAPRAAERRPGDPQRASKLRISELVRPNIVRLEPYHSAREKVQEGILLDANENPFPQKLDEISLNRYPDPHQKFLRKTIAGWLEVSPEQVLGGAGSDEVIEWIFKVFCESGRDRVVSVDPTYGMYRVVAEIFGVEVVSFRLGPGFSFEAERFLREVPKKVKVTFLCSPNNPTGNLLQRDQILALCRLWNGLVVVDEAYIDFAGQPSLARETGTQANLIVLRTFSKAFGRAALRLGYAVASPEVISWFMKVKAPYNLSGITMLEGCRAIFREDERRSQVGAIIQERTRVAARLQGLEGVEEVFPSQANFVLFRTRTEAGPICEELFGQRIVVRDRSSMAGLDRCIRVTIGTPEENDRFLEALGAILERKTT